MSRFTVNWDFYESLSNFLSSIHHYPLFQSLVSSAVFPETGKMNKEDSFIVILLWTFPLTLHMCSLCEIVTVLLGGTHYKNNYQRKEL